MIVPVPLWLLLLSHGSLIGCVAIQHREIGKLKKMARDLQNDNSRLKQLIIKQQENVDTLLVEYSKLKFYQVLNKNRQKRSIRGALLLEYQYKEFIDILIKVVNENGDRNLSEEQKQYFELCTRLMEEKNIEEKNDKAMKAYILKKYRGNIRTMKDPQLVHYIEQVA